MADTSGIHGWTHTTAEIPPRGLDVVREASPQDLVALAGALDVLGVERLKATYVLSPRTRGRYRLTGKLEARVVQACIVTLDPVACDVCDLFDVEFRPDGDLPVEASAAEHELAALEAEEYEPIVQNRMEVGRVFVEALTAALPAYPRSPGAELGTREAGPADGGTANPFAALAGWKSKSE